MRTSVVAGLAFILSLPSVWAAPEGGQAKRPQAEKVPILQSWSGKLANKALRRFEPAEGFILEAPAWAKLWQAWRPEEEIPALDFQTEMALVLTADGPNSVGCVPTHDGRGNVRALGMSTLIGGPGFGYLLLRVSREGIKTVNGKPLPGVEPPPVNPPGQKAKPSFGQVGPFSLPGAARQSPRAKSETASSRVRPGFGRRRSGWFGGQFGRAAA